MVANRECITDTTLYKRGEWIKLKIKVSENIVKDRDDILKKQSKFKGFCYKNQFPSVLRNKPLKI